MLRRMQMIQGNELVSATFEACAAFGPTGDGSPVCAGCGWLETEHDTVVVHVPSAEIHTLTPRRPSRRAEKRLAS